MTEDGNETPAERTQSLNAKGKRPWEATASAKKADKAKRVRVSRACDQCRAGREKCDGAQPTCNTCETQSRTCAYNEQPKKRGIQPNYIRTLELTLAWILQHFPDSEDQLTKLLPRTHEEAHRIISFKDAPAAEALHAMWRNGIISRQIEQLLSGGDIEIPRAGTSRDAINAPYRSPPLAAPSDLEALPREQQGATATGDVGVLSAQEPESSGVSMHEALVLPQNAWALLEHYFAFTQTWLPITEKHDIMRLMYSYPLVGLAVGDALDAEHAELWSILAWSAMSMGPQSGTNFELCHGVAKSLLPSRHGFQLGHVKALLILGIIELARNSQLAAWLTIGSAVRIITHFQSGQGLEIGSGGTRLKHTMMAAFLLEQVVASKTEAVGHLRCDDVRTLGLLVEDGLEEWEPWNDPAASSSSTSAKAPARSISTFNYLIRLALRDAHEVTSPMPSLATRSDLSVVVFSLLRNASPGNERLHPVSILTAQHLDNATSHRQSLDISRRRTEPPPAQQHARTTSSPLPGWKPQTINPGGAYIEPHYPFRSKPNETPDPMPGSKAAQSWAPGKNVNGADDPSKFNADSIDHSRAGGGDIFEELAMLERADSTHNPNFMQNLGFGPDLDLAEFFGADYQPSNPLLSYVQPESFGELPQDLDRKAEGAG